jgi:hypothetical protein
MAKSPTKTMANTMASRHGRGRTKRGAPHRACKCRTCKQQAHGKERCAEAASPREESCERGTTQDGSERRAWARSVDREVMIMPDWLVFQYHGTQADQDYQHCCSTPERAETKIHTPAPEDRKEECRATAGEARNPTAPTAYHFGVIAVNSSGGL